MHAIVMTEVKMASKLKFVNAGLNSKEYPLFSKKCEDYGFGSVRDFIVGMSLLLDMEDITIPVSVRSAMVKIRKDGNDDS